MKTWNQLETKARSQVYIPARSLVYIQARNQLRGLQMSQLVQLRLEKLTKKRSAREDRQQYSTRVYLLKAWYQSKKQSLKSRMTVTPHQVEQVQKKMIYQVRLSKIRATRALEANRALLALDLIQKKRQKRKTKPMKLSLQSESQQMISSSLLTTIFTASLYQRLMKMNLNSSRHLPHPTLSHLFQLQLQQEVESKA